MPKTQTPEQPRRAGRPAIGDVLKVRISDEMKLELGARAERYGMSLSEYVRALLVADMRRDPEE